MTREDVHSLSQAVEALKIIKEGELGEEKEALKELQQEREEYNEVLIIDIHVLKITVGSLSVIPTDIPIGNVQSIKFVLPNWNLFGHMLCHYFELWLCYLPP